jgi:tetratricopeptide (TPR) repeat protein
MPRVQGWTVLAWFCVAACACAEPVQPGHQSESDPPIVASEQPDVGSSGSQEPVWEGEPMPLEMPFAGVLPPESVRDAIPIYEGLLRGVRFLFGAEDLRVARGLVFLATLHETLGELPKAETRLKEALTIVRAAHPLHADRGGVANNFGLFYARHGRTSSALPLFREASEVARGLRGSDRANLPIALQNLGSALLTLGELSAAQVAFLEALEVERSLDVPDDRRSAIVEGNYGIVLLRFGEHSRAAEALASALKAAPALRGLEAAAFQSSLGEALASAGRYSEAEQQLGGALVAAGAKDALRATILANLGKLHWSQGNLEGAEARLREGLQLVGGQRSSRSTRTALITNLAMVQLARGQAEGALAGLESALATLGAPGQRDPLVEVALLEAAAAVELELGRSRRARDRATQATALRTGYLEDVLRAGSEEQKLAFRHQDGGIHLLANLGVEGELATALLRQKGLILDALLEDRARARAARSPEQRHQLDRALSLRRQRFAARLSGANAPTLERLDRELAAAEAELGLQLDRGRPVRRAAAVEVPEVQRQLRADSALVDFVEFQAYVGKGRTERRYGALLLAARGKASWVELGPTAQIDREIQELQDLLRCPLRGRLLAPEGGACSNFEGELDRKLLRSLDALSALLWRPLEARLEPGIKDLFVSPDGELAFLPFAALRTRAGAFLGERHTFTLLASGRDLLGQKRPSGPRTISVYAVASDDARGAGGIEALPGVRREAQLVRSVAERVGWTPTVHLDEAATETRLRLEKAPGILHLASHAAYLRPEGSRLDRVLEPPLYRSFFALAGAGATLEAWRRGQLRTATEDDGVLTADEAATLGLEGTELVVLSACETGFGEARAGDGVLGLQRGFALAGARGLLLSLWPIGDGSTVDWMSSFYEGIFEGQEPARALQRAQSARLEKALSDGSLFDTVHQVAGFVYAANGGR